MSIIAELGKLLHETWFKTGQQPECFRLTEEEWEAVKQEAEPMMKPDPAISGDYLFGVPVKVYATREELEHAFMLEQHEIKPSAMFKHDWHD